jgi:hypothetical protein
LIADQVLVVLALTVQSVLFLRWLYRRIRNDELLRVFVQDMAENHLPHIYFALRAICRAQGIELPEQPPIRRIPISDEESRRRPGD